MSELSKMRLCDKFKWIGNELKGKCLSDGAHLYIWNDKFYERLETESEMYRYIKELYEKYWSDWIPKRGKEIHKDISGVYYCRPDEFKLPETWVCFNNMIYDLATNETITYNKAYAVTSVLPFDYTDDEPELFLKSLKEIIPNDVDRDKLLVFMRYALTTSIQKQLSLVCVGDGSNGKTKLLEFFAKMLGRKATTFTLNSLSGNEGSKTIVRFMDKTLAISSEIGGSFINTAQMDRLKSIITDEFQSGRPAYGKYVEWINTTKFVFATNKLPKVQDLDDKAFFRRFDIIQFTQTFEGDNRDETLFDRIFNTEAGAVLSYLVRYTGTYNMHPDLENVTETWLDAADLVRAFLKENVVETITTKKELKDVYRNFKSWCEDKGEKYLRQDLFKKRLVKNGVDIDIPEKVVQYDNEQYEKASTAMEALRNDKGFVD